MRKMLTEIHLVMEKKSFNYLKDIALELADFYGYGTKVKIKKGRYEGEKGFYHWHDNTIHIDPTIRSVKEFVITVLHEIKHAMQTRDIGGPDKMEIFASNEWSKAANGEYGSKAKRNPYKYVPYEMEAEKWAQKEYRKFWKDKF